MGWFLKHNKTKARKSKKPAANKAQPWDPQVTLARLKVAAAIVAIALGAYGWYAAERRLDQYVAQRFGEKPTAARVQLVDAPTWMSPALRDQLRSAAASELSADPLDQQSLEAAYAAVAASPWVRSLHSVRRLGDGRVALHAAYREPVALIEARDGYHLVDAEGVRLIGPYDRAQLDALGMPVVTGVRAGAPRAGARWPGEDVAAGLSLVLLLADEPAAEQIVAYDVSSRGPGGRLNLLLQTRGEPILWGMPPGQGQPIEPADSVKLRHLRNPYAIRSAAEGKPVLINGDVIRVLQPGDRDTARAVGYHFQP